MGSPEDVCVVPAIAAQCVQLLFERYDARVEHDVFFEPCVRNLAFQKALNDRSASTRAYRVGSTTAGVDNMSFLSVYPAGARRGGKYHVLGIPEYGPHSVEAAQYVTHAARFADTIALVLPISWAAPHAKRYTPDGYTVAELCEIPEEGLRHTNGSRFPTRMALVVWKKKDVLKLTAGVAEPPVVLRTLEEAIDNKPTTVLERALVTPPSAFGYDVNVRDAGAAEEDEEDNLSAVRKARAVEVAERAAAPLMNSAEAFESFAGYVFRSLDSAVKTVRGKDAGGYESV